MKKSMGPWAVVGSVLVAVVVAPFAIATGEGGSLRAGVRNPSDNEQLSLTRETEIIANTNTYGTRQSNKSNNGGGAVYGCRSGAGGSPQGNEPCIRANNLSNGRAFEFETDGTEVGAIVSSNPNAAPFVTNAKGVATGLNADQVDGKSATEIVTDARALTRFAAVSSTGALGGNRGATAAARTGEGTYTVTFADDISACALSATQTSIDNAGAVGVSLADDKKTVTVRTRSGGGDAGTDATAPADRPFHLTANC